MSGAVGPAMRDVFIDALNERMRSDRKIYFLSADFGAPSLDRLREEHADRFLNVGIAEQNLIGVAAGLALEGFTVFAYGIAPFLAMRDFEQVRVHLALLSQARPLNVNLLSVGAGVSYEVSGPTHHCPEDLSLIRTLPNVEILSPCDAPTARRCLDRALAAPTPKYLRFDGKPLPAVYDDTAAIDFAAGFHPLVAGTGACLVATGFATHRALALARKLESEGIRVGVIDVFSLRPIDGAKLARLLGGYQLAVTIEEGFVGKGGLDSLVRDILSRQGEKTEVKGFGFADTYVFDSADRAGLHRLYGLDEEAAADVLRRAARGG